MITFQWAERTVFILRHSEQAWPFARVGIDMVMVEEPESELVTDMVRKAAR